MTEQIQNFIARPKINLLSFKSNPDSLKECFKAFGTKPSLGAPDYFDVFFGSNVVAETYFRLV